MVYGDEMRRLYSLSSSVCMAAIHAGAIMEGSGGEVLVHLSTGVENFNGSVVNGVTSHPGSSPTATI